MYIVLVKVNGPELICILNTKEGLLVIYKCNHYFYYCRILFIIINLWFIYRKSKSQLSFFFPKRYRCFIIASNLYIGRTNKNYQSGDFSHGSFVTITMFTLRLGNDLFLLDRKWGDMQKKK